jgi:hypothetical protein
MANERHERDMQEPLNGAEHAAVEDLCSILSRVLIRLAAESESRDIQEGSND